MDSIFCKSSSPAVSPLPVPWGVATVTGRPHVLGASFWSKDPIVLVLSRLHYARLPGTGASASHPSHTHSPALSLTQNTPHILCYRGAAVWLCAHTLKNSLFTKMLPVTSFKMVITWAHDALSKNTQAHTRQKWFSFSSGTQQNPLLTFTNVRLPHYILCWW